MRKVLVVEKFDATAKDMAANYGISEIACKVPRFEGLVTFYPAIVVESSTNPGTILGVFNPANFTLSDLNSLEDLPAPSAPPDVNNIYVTATLKPTLVLGNSRIV